MENKIVDCQRQNDLEICDCDCHKPGFDIKHIIPCCEICPHCKKRFKGTANFHTKKCSQNPKNQKYETP